TSASRRRRSNGPRRDMALSYEVPGTPGTAPKVRFGQGKCYLEGPGRHAPRGVRDPDPRPGRPMTDLERELHRRYEVRTERFSHAGFEVEMLLPRSADALIDDSEFNEDERLPYWAELWPSARALTRFLLDGPAPGGPVLELGCGVALPSLALRARGAAALAADCSGEALEFARASAERNGIPSPELALLDWRHPPPELGRFPLVVAADVLYERRNADALAALLPRVVAPSGS